MQIPYSLKGRTALIAGASFGFGAHFSELFAKAGANVVLGARRAERIKKLLDKINKSGGNALPVPLYVTEENSVIAAYNAAEATFGTVDTIVANAWLSASGRTTDLPLEDVQRLVNTNFMGVYVVALEGAKRLIASGSREMKMAGLSPSLASLTRQMARIGKMAEQKTGQSIFHQPLEFPLAV